MTSLASPINHLRAHLEGAGIRFVVGGAFALTAHTVPRFTEDLDVMVLTRDLDLVHRAMTSDRFERINDVTYRDVETRLVIDVFTVDDEAQQQVFRDARPAELHGAKPVGVLTPSGLAVMLLREATRGDQRKRPLRLRDVEIMARVAGLDWPYIRDWARKMGYDAAYEELRVDDKPPL